MTNAADLQREHIKTVAKSYFMEGPRRRRSCGDADTALTFIFEGEAPRSVMFWQLEEMGRHIRAVLQGSERVATAVELHLEEC